MATLLDKLYKLERNDIEHALEIVRAGHAFGDDAAEILFMSFDEPYVLVNALRDAGLKIKRKPESR